MGESAHCQENNEWTFPASLGTEHRAEEDGGKAGNREVPRTALRGDKMSSRSHPLVRTSGQKCLTKNPPFRGAWARNATVYETWLLWS